MAHTLEKNKIDMKIYTYQNYQMQKKGNPKPNTYKYLSVESLDANTKTNQILKTLKQGVILLMVRKYKK